MRKKCKECGKTRNVSGLNKFRHCECTQDGYVNLSVVMLPYIIEQEREAFKNAYMTNPTMVEGMLRDGRLK